MRKPPKTVNIIGKTFTVHKRKFKKEQYGEMRYGMQEILLEPRQVDEQMKDTLWHEILHAIERSLGLKLKEHEVHAIAAAQVQVMFDNPKLMEYILK